MAEEMKLAYKTRDDVLQKEHRTRKSGQVRVGLVHKGLNK